MEIDEISDPIVISNTILFLKLKNKKIVKREEINDENLKNRILNSKKVKCLTCFQTAISQNLKT